MPREALEVIVGDITQLQVDAIVNAANAQLAGGGGVDGAIHRAAGAQQLHEACRKLGGCPTGQVKLTPGFDLPANYILHAVGPVWHGGNKHEPELLASCYRNAIGICCEQGFRSVAFPAISCGVYGYPPEKAVRIAVDSVIDAINGLELRVIFCCFQQSMADLYRTYLANKGLNH